MTHPAPGAMRRLLTPLIAPDVFDFWASKVNSTWSWERPLARIVARRPEAHGAVTLVLQPNRHFAGFVPGQHINVTAEIDGVRVTRSYSPTNIPAADRRVELTVKQIDGGRMSTHLIGHTQVGDVLELGPAFGEMTWPEAADGRWLLLAAGSGITPMMSLVRAWAAACMPGELTLVYTARTQAELCFAAELRALAAREPRFHLHLLLTRESDAFTGAPNTERGGRLDADWLQRRVPDLAAHTVYACGPTGFVESARQIAGNLAARFHAEAFTPPALVDDVAGTVRVELRASGRTLELPAGQSLLAALEAQGVHPAHGCRMGICNTCACGKLSGTTQDLNTGDRDAEPNSALRICVNRACSDLTLDL